MFSGPKILELGRGGLRSSGRLAGPWYDGSQEGVGVEEGRRDDLETGGMGRGEGSPPRRSYTLQRSEGYDVDKKQVLVEKEVGARTKPGSF